MTAVDIVRPVGLRETRTLLGTGEISVAEHLASVLDRRAHV